MAPTGGFGIDASSQADRLGTLRRLPFSHGKKAKTKSESVLEIEFSGPVSGSGDLAAYQLSSVTTKKVKKKVGTTYEPIRLISALPASSPMTASVSLLPSTKPNLATDRSARDRCG